MIGLGRRKPVRTLLPSQPISITIEPWWLINVGCVTDEDVKSLSAAEKDTLDRLIDNLSPIEAGRLNFECVHLLHKKGLVYLDVPLNETDQVELPPLEGFVMNRITGDYFETLLYKLFVSIDERINLADLASLLQIDIDLVINAVSVYCRLAFAKKKFSSSSSSLNESSSKLDSSWDDYLKNANQQKQQQPKRLTLLGELTDVSLSDRQSSPPESAESDKCEIASVHSVCSADSNSVQTLLNPNQRRIGFLFDSTLTAFLMMGNLSLGLKNHAVTM
jgi:hypothetical protein